MVELLDMPPEVVGLICGRVKNCKDLLSLCRTSKTLHHSALPHLYSSVELKLSEGVLTPGLMESLLDVENPGACSIRHIYFTIALGQGQSEPFHEEVNHGTKKGQLLNTLVLSVLKRVPANALRTFHWKIPVQPSAKVAEILRKRQKSIDKLHMSYSTVIPVRPNRPVVALPDMKLPNVTTLGLHCIKDQRHLQDMRQWLKATPKIEKLNIHANWQIQERCGKKGDEKWNFWDKIPKLAHLRTLKIDEVFTKGMERCVDLSKLTSFHSRSCGDIFDLLDSWREKKPVNLKKLVLTLHATGQGTVKDMEIESKTATAVNEFLMCFTGLEELCLLSRVHEAIPWDAIYCHQKTLRRLVIDTQQSQARTNSTYGPAYGSRVSQILEPSDILRLYTDYPMLEEVGFNCDYNKHLDYIGVLSRKVRYIQLRNNKKNPTTTTVAKTILNRAVQSGSTFVPKHFRAHIKKAEKDIFFKTPNLRLLSISSEPNASAYPHNLYPHFKRNQLMDSILIEPTPRTGHNLRRNPSPTMEFMSEGTVGEMFGTKEVKFLKRQWRGRQHPSVRSSEESIHLMLDSEDNDSEMDDWMDGIEDEDDFHSMGWPDLQFHDVDDDIDDDDFSDDDETASYAADNSLLMNMFYAHESYH